jgi:hypothetical protein
MQRLAFSIDSHRYLKDRISLLKKAIVELYEEEKHRKSLSYSAVSQPFGSKTQYFVVDTPYEPPSGPHDDPQEEGQSGKNLFLNTWATC